MVAVFQLPLMQMSIRFSLEEDCERLDNQAGKA